MTPAAIDGGDLFALAKLMLESDEVQASVDDEQLRAARETERHELERQVEALHDAANAVRIGAFVEGGVAALGGAASIFGTATEPVQSKGASQLGAASSAAEKWSKVEIECGQAVSRLAAPAGALLGGSVEKDAEARAKQHEALSADAGARAAEVERHRDRVLDDEDRMLSTLQSTLQTEAAGRLALIANA